MDLDNLTPDQLKEVNNRLKNTRPDITLYRQLKEVNNRLKILDQPFLYIQAGFGEEYQAVRR